MVKTLRPVWPNAGLEVEYRKKLLDLVEAMHKSVLYWVKARWRSNPPELAMDDSPASSLRVILAQLVKRWQSRFDQASKDLADYFTKAMATRSDAALKQALKNGGFTVKWRMTRAMNDVLRATIEEQVGLIRSIPQRYLGQVQVMVMKSIQTGRDLESLSKSLQSQLGVTKKRAALIARDQNNKATANFNRVRQLELGIDKAVWVHSGGGREPRATHLAAGRSKTVFSVAEGWYDSAEGRHVLPGELINCRCVSRPVIEGFS